MLRRQRSSFLVACLLLLALVLSTLTVVTMAHRLHQPLRGLRSSLRPPPIHPSQKRAFSFPSRPPPPPPAAARRAPSSSLPLSALRSLAQHIVSSSKRYFSSQPAGGARASLKHKHLPQDMASRMRTLAGTMPGGGFHSSASGARFGPGGLGRGPMGPGVRGAFSRGVGNVGLGSARGYASMSRPLFDGIIGNTPRQSGLRARLIRLLLTAR